MVPVSSKLWTKKHGFGRKDMPRSRSTQTVNLKMRQRSEFGSKKELNQRKSSYTRASRLILSKGKNTESVEGTTGSLSLHLVRKMCTTLQANGKFGSMQTTTTAGSDEPLKLALAMALLRSKLVNKTSETSHPPSDTSSSEALKWKRKEFQDRAWILIFTTHSLLRVPQSLLFKPQCSKTKPERCKNLPS
ncbi:hypothetical protein HanXRQr2_Chr02g0084271 [Helianthus annuus]|uniref:Uncharacterized protein n=1 Tax=Helianthus annuus TaxID=4232 RepID=A0A9K3JSW8_HELAN|nr:hypothetical protein HanXRQr2_Chr02g0084271 [Helianthus annuus]